MLLTVLSDERCDATPRRCACTGAADWENRWRNADQERRCHAGVAVAVIRNVRQVLEQARCDSRCGRLPRADREYPAHSAAAAAPTILEQPGLDHALFERRAAHREHVRVGCRIEDVQEVSETGCQRIAPRTTVTRCRERRYMGIRDTLERRALRYQKVANTCNCVVGFEQAI